ncbi:hypothetical protein [Phenylobacterium sp.]|jgi:hypothetical protein|uniref:hypothetical protein n=1 Tax=Phenylobacterium sp. TaxID=1871053 RepID=UPI002F941BAE
MSNIDPTMGGQAGASPDEGGGATSTTKEMIGKARQEAAHFASQAQQRAVGEIEKHKSTATETLGQFANAIRRAGDELSGSDQSMAARFVGQAADGLENFARALGDKRPEELVDTVREFSRRNPTAFVAGAVLAGLALGRFLRSTETGGQVGFADNSGGEDWAVNEPAVFTGVGEDTGAVGSAMAADDVDVGAAESLETQVSGGIGGVAGATDETLTSDIDASEDTARGGDTDRSRFGGPGI